MNKKGFTLIEIISVISILAIIGLIAVPVANNIIKKSKTKMYDEQTSRIEQACRNYVLENDDLLPEEGKTTKVTIKKLKDNGYLPDESIINPLTEEEMKGGIVISYSNNKYTYTYDDNIKEFALYHPRAQEGDYLVALDLPNYATSIDEYNLNEIISSVPAGEKIYIYDYPYTLVRIGNTYYNARFQKMHFSMKYYDQVRLELGNDEFENVDLENGDLYDLQVFIEDNMYIESLFEYILNASNERDEISFCEVQKEIMRVELENNPEFASEYSSTTTEEYLNLYYSSCLTEHEYENLNIKIIKFPLTSERNLD